MYLKNVTLCGFKSFARPTTVEFVRGLNVIVGPNGAGKSNLIDALRWVLSERRDTRGSGGQKIIFYGSTRYPPVGMASVELLLERDGTSPFRIEKRTFTSGETEYFLEGTRVRLRDLRRKLLEWDTSLGRIEVAFVTSKDLHEVSDLRPSECLRWLEEISGVSEKRAHLFVSFELLERARRKKERFEERLKELALQRERVFEWATKEEAYLCRKRRWQAAKRAYLLEVVTQKRGELQRISSQKILLDEELYRLESSQEGENLAERERHLSLLSEDLRLWSSKVAKRRKEVEEEEKRLYHLLTQIRERKKASFLLEAKCCKLLQRINDLEKERNSLEIFPSPVFDELRKTEEVISLFLREREKHLQTLDVRRGRLREELARLKAAIGRLRKEKEKLSLKLAWTQEEIIRIGESLDRESAYLVKIGEKEAELCREEKELSEKGARLRAVLERVRERIGNVETKVAQLRDLEEIRRLLLEKGWSQRSTSALLGFLGKIKIVATREDLSPFEGEGVTRPFFLPPFSSAWSEEKEERILEAFFSDQEVSSNLVAFDGSCLFLRGGFLVFPRRLVAGRRFVENWEKRKARLERTLSELEQKIKKVVEERKEMERIARERELQFVKWQENLRQKEEARKETEGMLLLLEEDLKSLEGQAGKVQAEILELERMAQEEKRICARSERSLKKVGERRKREEEKKRSWEKFVLEVQRIQEEGRELLEAFRGNRENLLFLNGELLQVVESVRQGLENLRGEEEFLRQCEREKEALEGEIRLRREEERALERRREKLLRERERLLFQEEKILEGLAHTERELQTLPETSLPEFQNLELKELEVLVQCEEEALSREEIRQGAVEEYRELSAREERLRAKSDFLDELLLYAEGKLKGLEGEVRRSFTSFFEETREAFSYYFGRIFEGGEVSLRIQEGVHLEVQLPGKKRQVLGGLSSGERTIVALCFLCAILEANRLKVCFFDEIDANLDHTNSVLLAQVLKEFSHSRQVILVTHKEEVMELADRVIGITMSEPGVSQVLLCEEDIERLTARG
ncbi:MAG: AAA family ATPase [Candidatus Caldatribacteriaceae bacterium]